MAKEVVGSITSAVTGAVADKAVSKFVDNLGNGKQTPVADKLLRLERLHMRIRSAVEVSEKYAIESASLLRWREDLKEAAARGGEVLLSFQQRDGGNHQQPSSSSAAASAGAGTAMSFTRNALWSMARRMISTAAASVLLSGDDEDAKKLDAAVEALEKASENIGHFIALFQTSPKLKRRRTYDTYYYRVPQTDASEGGVEMEQTDASPAETAELKWFMDASPAATTYGPAERLQDALLQISWALEISGIQDMKGLDWLAEWTEVLRQASQQGGVLLQVVIAKARKETTGYDHEDDDIHSFVHTIESLAEDSKCFIQLALFCPPI